MEGVGEVNVKHKATITKLTQKTIALENDLKLSGKVKKEVKVEPVYIDRPVEVEKVVEKIVEVEKVVTKHIEPTTFRDEELEVEIKSLQGEIARLAEEIKIMEERHILEIKEYEESIKVYEEN